MEIIDLPQEIARASKLTWTMESNHGFVSSPFSGVGQVQRGQLERWRLAFDFRSLKSIDAGIIEGFFLQLEGNANVFRCYDPSRIVPKGQVWGELSLARDHAAGSRSLDVTGIPPSLHSALLAGDWIQIGHQLTKVKKAVHSDEDGNGSIEIWPKLWSEHSQGQNVEYHYPKGIFRFLSEPPEWQVVAGVARPWSFKLTGAQEVITDGHPLLQS